jgi:hypothetical protein
MHSLSRRSLLGGVASLALASAAGAQAGTVPYQTINGRTLQLRAFVGRNMALLLDPARSVDQSVTERVRTALDQAWGYHVDFSGRTPTPYRNHAGKTTVAEVAESAFRAGFAGVEVAPSSVSLLLSEARRDRYNQAAFFVMARNFWFYEAPLGKISAFQTGFAHLQRFHSMDAAGVTGAPWDDTLDFDHYRRSIVIEMLARYLADSTLTWENTLGADKGPANPHGWGAGELAAGFLHRIRRDHGEAGYRRFWRMMRDAPAAESAKEAASRFVQIARLATGTDYRGLFKDNSLQLVY